MNEFLDVSSEQPASNRLLTKVMQDRDRADKVKAHLQQFTDESAKKGSGSNMPPHLKHKRFAFLAIRRDTHHRPESEDEQHYHDFVTRGLHEMEAAIFQAAVGNTATVGEIDPHGVYGTRNFINTLSEVITHLANKAMPVVLAEVNRVLRTIEGQRDRTAQIV